MKKIFSRVLSTIMTLALLVSCVSATAFAAEAENVTAEPVYEVDASTRAVLYLNDWADFDYGTGLKPLSIAMPRGSYTLYYSVTKPTTLILWHDSYTEYDFELSGSGSKTIWVGLQCTHWQCLSDYADVSVSFTIE